MNEGNLDMSKSTVTDYSVNTPREFLNSLSFAIDKTKPLSFKFWPKDQYGNLLQAPSTLTLAGNLNADPRTTQLQALNDSINIYEYSPDPADVSALNTGSTTMTISLTQNGQSGGSLIQRLNVGDGEKPLLDVLTSNDRKMTITSDDYVSLVAGKLRDHLY